jgi:hypothetical protein
MTFPVEIRVHMKLAVNDCTSFSNAIFVIIVFGLLRRLLIILHDIRQVHSDVS